MINRVNHKGSQKLVIDIWGKISKKRKFQIFLILIVTFLSGISEIINLSAFVPFLLVLTDTNKILDYEIIIKFANFFEITNQNDLIVPVTLIFALTVLLTGLIKILNLWLNTHMAALIGNDLSKEAYRKTLLKPYLLHIQGNSSGIINCIANNIPATVKIIDRSLTIINSINIVISILIGLLIFNAKVTFLVVTILLIIYFALSFFSRLKLKLNGKIINEKQKEQIKIIQESLGSIKDIIVFNCKKIYLSNYNRLDKSIRNLYSEVAFLSAFPRYGIESFALFMLIISSLFLRTQQGYKEETLLILGIFALSAQRLLPNLQIIYNSLSSIRANFDQASNILEILNQRIPRDYLVNNSLSLNFKKSIKFENICFKYRPNNNNVIKNFNFELFKGENIGIIGKTGSGKSTLIDIFLGLIKPSQGKFLVDGIDIFDKNNPGNIEKWQNLLTYVPQDIFLTDNSFMENIAYGVPPELINLNEVTKCAKNAKIHEYILSTTNGYETFVGERGIKLSGGQIQRIGIARALYKKSKIIVFDEATSALDNYTETKVIQSIRSLKNDFTTIMIAHRLNSLVNCDRIIDIDSGRIKRIISKGDLGNSEIS